MLLQYKFDFTKTEKELYNLLWANRLLKKNRKPPGLYRGQRLQEYIVSTASIKYSSTASLLV